MLSSNLDKPNENAIQIEQSKQELKYFVFMRLPYSLGAFQFGGEFLEQGLHLERSTVLPRSRQMKSG
jgi:hypothetical protein